VAAQKAPGSILVLLAGHVAVEADGGIVRVLRGVGAYG
jgi:hypothetical protein